MKNLVICIILSTILPILGAFYNDFEPEILDARAESMGRTSILSSEGANYVFNNPAMLSELEQIELCLNSRVKFGIIVMDIESESGYTGISEIYKPIHFKFNGVSCCVPHKFAAFDKLKFGFGLGYRAYYDYGNNNHTEDEGASTNIKNHGGLNTVVLGTGCKYKENFSGGISLSVSFQSDCSTEIIEDGNTIEEKEFTVSGTFMTCSINYKLSEKYVISFRMRDQFNLDSDVDSNQKTRIHIPAEYGFALKYKPQKDRVIFAEYLTRRYGNYKLSSSTNISDGEMFENSKAGFALRGGIETLIKGRVFRGGIFIQSVREYELTYDLDGNRKFDNSPATELGLTLGSAFELSKHVTLDMYGIFSWFNNYIESYNYFQETILSKRELYNYDFKIGCSLRYKFY